MLLHLSLSFLLQFVGGSWQFSRICQLSFEFAENYKFKPALTNKIMGILTVILSIVKNNIEKHNV